MWRRSLCANIIAARMGFFTLELKMKGLSMDLFTFLAGMSWKFPKIQEHATGLLGH